MTDRPGRFFVSQAPYRTADTSVYLDQNDARRRVAQLKADGEVGVKLVWTAGTLAEAAAMARSVAEADRLAESVTA